MSLGSLTFFFPGDVGGDAGALFRAVGFIQLSKILDSRLWDIELRHSEDAVKNPGDEDTVS